MANSAASQIITDAQGITKVDISSIGLPGLEQTMVLRVIDKANREYYQKFLLGGGEPKTDRTAETGGTIAASAILNGSASVGDTGIALSSVSTDFTYYVLHSEVTDAGVIWDENDPDFIGFDSLDALSLVGVTGIGFAHDDQEEFSLLYALPADFESFRSAADSPDGVMVNGIPYIFTSGIPYGNQFSVHDDGTTKHLFFPRGMTGDYSVRYNKGPTAITTTASLIDAPAGDEDFITYRLCAHIFRVLGVDPNKVIEANKMADKTMLDALKTRNVGKRLKPGRSYNIGGYRNRYPLSEAVNQIIY